MSSKPSALDATQATKLVSVWVSAADTEGRYDDFSQIIKAVTSMRKGGNNALSWDETSILLHATAVTRSDLETKCCSAAADSEALACSNLVKGMLGTIAPGIPVLNLTIRDFISSLDDLSDWLQTGFIPRQKHKSHLPQEQPSLEEMKIALDTVFSVSGTASIRSYLQSLPDVTAFDSAMAVRRRYKPHLWSTAEARAVLRFALHSRDFFHYPRGRSASQRVREECYRNLMESDIIRKADRNKNARVATLLLKIPAYFRRHPELGNLAKTSCRHRSYPPEFEKIATTPDPCVQRALPDAARPREIKDVSMVPAPPGQQTYRSDWRSGAAPQGSQVTQGSLNWPYTRNLMPQAIVDHHGHMSDPTVKWSHSGSPTGPFTVNNPIQTNTADKYTVGPSPFQDLSALLPPSDGGSTGLLSDLEPFFHGAHGSPGPCAQ